ncbi:hypothetical protein PVAP13_1NG397000 [Panicum virgatum]|uniref:DUF295 domain-containing protein n=1 Tax=Panicum virgatum TaxID=38727 RepID=A0A8T0X521_PANVG|nr:hypothetical protein PVAP13_1NG397000 [Panicum virgatum]
MPVVIEDKWSQLPPELLHLICRKLPDTGNFIQFRAVCTSWQDGAPLSDPPPQLPWILEHRGSKLQARRHLCFYSHSSGKMYCVLVGARSSWLLGSGAFQGHVIAIADLAKTMLYNPFTSEVQALRPAPYKPWLDGVFHVVGDGDAGCMVVNTCTVTRHFAYCRPGVDAGWNIFDERKDMCHNTYLPAPSMENFATALGDYLVASHGKILRALQYPHDGNQVASASDYYFNVYQLDMLDDNKARWRKVETIGNAVLFFDNHGHGFSLEPNDSAGLRRDCIYFVHKKRMWVRFCNYRSLCRYSIHDGRVDKTMSLANKLGETWVIPSLCYADE